MASPHQVVDVAQENGHAPVFKPGFKLGLYGVIGCANCRRLLAEEGGLGWLVALRVWNPCKETESRK